MLHILWLILKILLIIIASILGFVICIILLILFCPIQYYASVDKSPDQSFKEFHAMAKVAWLFHGISFRIDYQNGKPEFVIRLLGIPISKVISMILNMKNKRSGNRRSVNKQSENEQSTNSDQLITENQKQIEPINLSDFNEENEPAGLGASDIEDQVTEDISLENQSHNQSEDQSGKNLFVAVANLLSRIISVIKTLFFMPARIFRKISNVFRRIINICHKIKNISQTTYDKMNWYKMFVQHPRTKNAIKLIWEDGKSLVRHVLPRKIKGKIVFDFEDPYYTGLVLAVTGMTIPVHKNSILIRPLFENQNYFEGNMRLSGRVFGFVFLKTALEIYFNRNVKFVIKKWKHKEAA